MSELLLGLLGGGSFVSLVTAFLQYRQKQNGSDIEWYDRAVAQVNMQDETITRLKAYIDKIEQENRRLGNENDDLKDIIEELEDLVMEMEKEKMRLIHDLEEYKKGAI